MADPLRIVLPLPFNEAIKAAARREVVLPDVYYGDIQGAARSQAFSVAGMAKISQLQAVLDTMNDGLRSGLSFGEFQKQAAEQGWDLPQNRLDLVMRMHTQTAYQAGHWEQFDRLAETRGFLMYSAINDSRTRPAHRAMDGIMKPVGDSFWDDHSPPCGYNCRCSLISLTQDQVDARGGQTQQVPPDARADPGFGSHPEIGPHVLDERIGRAIVDTHGSLQKSLLDWYENLSQEKIIERVRAYVSDYSTLADELHDFLYENTGIIAEHEAVAIRTYTSSSYVQMNAFLRGKAGADDNLMAAVTSATAGLSKLPEYEGLVMRGINTFAVADREAFIAGHAPGSVIEYRAFTSASYNNPFLGDMLFRIRSLTGRVVETLATDPMETEVLFLPGTKFRVVSVEGNSPIVVELEELEDQTVEVPKHLRFAKGSEPRVSETAQSRAQSEVASADPEAIERFKAEHDGMEPLEYALSRFPSAAIEVAQHAPHLLKKPGT